MDQRIVNLNGESVSVKYVFLKRNREISGALEILPDDRIRINRRSRGKIPRLDDGITVSKEELKEMWHQGQRIYP